MKTPDKDNGDNSEQTIIYLNELCRLCLARKKTMVPIYDGHNEDVPIPVKLMACVNLEVYKGDGLPTKLCQTCKDNLDQSYQFRKKCHDAHKKLNNHKQIIADLNAESEDNNEESLETPEIEKSLPVKQQLSQEDQQIVSSLPSGSATAKKQNLEEIYNIKLVGMKREEESMIRESSDLTDIISDYNSADGSTWDGNNYVYTMEESEEGGSEAPGRLEPLEENTTSENGELKVFKCDQCPKAFTRRIMLKSHQTVHSTQRGFTCQACEKWFPTRSALIRHERTHTGEKPFGCNICNRAFAQKEILLRHLMTHSGQKPFQCQDCDKSFTQREALRVHMRRHQKLDPNDIQLHHCQLCPKAFCHASGLSRHLVTHTGRTYKCVECEKSFTDKSSLLRHSRIHAPI